MSKIKINRLTNANVYVGTGSMLGRAQEVEIPDIKFNMAEHKSLGMVGTFETPTGLEKMEAKFKWSSMYPEVVKEVANPFKAVKVQVRASIDEVGAGGITSQTPIVVHMTGTFKNMQLGAIKANEGAGMDTAMAVHYIKIVIDGSDNVEIDVLANIYKVNGVDILSTYRKNIGG